MCSEILSKRPYEVLVVEDNRDDVELFFRALRKVQAELGIEINAHAISDGSGATAQIRGRKFDVIFLDLNMPPPDGMELAKDIRKSQINRTTPIVMITGADERGLVTRAFQAGVNLFLFKPIDRARLLRIIQVASVPVERERRRVQRVKVKCRVTIESGQDRLDGETLDLSLNGMLVHAARAFPVGSIVSVSLALPSANAPIRASARIVRVVGSEFMGLQLETIGKAESEAVGEFLVPLVVAPIEGGR
jgi:CheY-like chemotaxis protein